ncbi:hypothetical protein MS3_00006104 [Schistosoma haematobium]|uniref:Uncharacterized protein n=1 Tax=Schistosoma haematobium TaxID=6185 RepID=A0A922LHV8_SCHHA|nr:hypothetical protein MS3_00006104 [Schistosoma haematobium]KAH9584541.1 hypothetical protein MS3_00006104 [Schistosoma haematobium]
MRLQAHEIRTRLPSHVPVAEYGYPYASATSRTVNNRYGVGLFLCCMHATLFSFLIFFLFPEPTPSTISVWFRRLQSTLAKAGLITHALVNVLSRYIGFECLAYAWSRTWSLRSLLVFWLNVVSSYVCSVSGPHSLRTPSSDSGYKPLSCSMPTQATNIAHRSWYRSPKTTFVGNSTINDRFPVRQSFRPTIARHPISPTIQTAIYRKCKHFLAGGSCSDSHLSREHDWFNKNNYYYNQLYQCLF